MSYTLCTAITPTFLLGMDITPKQYTLKHTLHYAEYFYFLTQIISLTLEVEETGSHQRIMMIQQSI